MNGQRSFGTDGGASWSVARSGEGVRWRRSAREKRSGRTDSGSAWGSASGQTCGRPGPLDPGKCAVVVDALVVHDVDPEPGHAGVSPQFARDVPDDVLDEGRVVVGLHRD